MYVNIRVRGGTKIRTKALDMCAAKRGWVSEKNRGKKDCPGQGGKHGESPL